MSTDAGAAVPSPATVSKSAAGHIRLTSHSGGFGALPIHWGAPTAAERGPVARHHHQARAPQRDRHPQRLLQRLPRAGGGRGRAVAGSTGPTSPTRRPPTPSARTRSGAIRDAIVSLDPWGAMVADAFSAELAAGYDIRPTIAVTKAHVILPEIIEAVQKGRLRPDGGILLPSGAALVTKAAIEPVWYLPGVAQRFGCSETDLRRVLFEETGGMYPELVTRGDLEVFLPPIGGQTVYIFGDPQRSGRSRRSS